MYNTPTSKALKIIQQLQEDLKEHQQTHKTKRDEYLLTKANLELDTGYKKKSKYNKKYQKVGTLESML